MTTITDANIKVRVSGGWLDIATGELIPVVGPDPDPDPADWQTAFDSRDIDGVIQAWYQDNTGHDPELDYELLPIGNWVVNATWLATNDGNGRVHYDAGLDRWFVERYQTRGMIRVAAHNITFTNIYQDGSLGSLYGIQSRLVDGNASGIIFSHCTIYGGEGSTSGAALNFPAATDPDQIIFEYCDVSGYRAGIYCFAGITARYCWSHDVFFSWDPVTGEPSHNTGSSIRGGNCHFYRIFVSDGNSSACSFYPEVGPYTNVIVEECILRMPDADTGAEAILASGRAYSNLLEGETRAFRNNLLYRGGNLGCDIDGSVATEDDLPEGLGAEDRNLTYTVLADGLERSWMKDRWSDPFDATAPAGGTGSNIRVVTPGAGLTGFSEVSGNIDRLGNPVIPGTG